MDIAEQYCLYLRSLVLAAGSNGYRILFHKDLSGMDKSIGRHNSSNSSGMRYSRPSEAPQRDLIRSNKKKQITVLGKKKYDST